MIQLVIYPVLSLTLSVHERFFNAALQTHREFTSNAMQCQILQSASDLGLPKQHHGHPRSLHPTQLNTSGTVSTEWVIFSWVLIWPDVYSSFSLTVFSWFFIWTSKKAPLVQMVAAHRQNRLRRVRVRESCWYEVEIFSSKTDTYNTWQTKKRGRAENLKRRKRSYCEI